MKNDASRELAITRTLNAPRTLVFEAWTKPEHLFNWWGPNGFTNTFHETDIRVGGTWKFTMHGPDGVDYENVITYTEITPPERIAYLHGSDDPNDPNNFEVEVTFEERGNQTFLTLLTRFASAEILQKVLREVGAEEGGKQTLNRLAEHVINMEPVVVERTFAAPASVIWRAITDRNEMAKWYFKLEKFEPIKGFEFQFTGGPEDGVQYLHFCKITEVIEGQKLAYSWRFDGYAGDSEVSFELFPEGDQTRVRITHAGVATFPAIKYPDLARHNFEAGWRGILDVALAGYLGEG